MVPEFSMYQTFFRLMWNYKIVTVIAFIAAESGTFTASVFVHGWSNRNQVARFTNRYQSSSIRTFESLVHDKCLQSQYSERIWGWTRHQMAKSNSAADGNPQNNKNNDNKNRKQEDVKKKETLQKSDPDSTESFSVDETKDNLINNTSSNTIASMDMDSRDGKKKNTGISSTTRDMSTIEAVVRKKIKVARAQAEIDRILTGPDPPFDVDQEWKKVVSVAPVSQGMKIQDGNVIDKKYNENSIASDEEDVTTASMALSLSNSSMPSSLNSIVLKSDNLDFRKQQQQTEDEMRCKELETELYRAIEMVDFDTASQRRESLDNLQIENANSALQLNAAFYKAFSSKNYDAMASLWIPDGTATCIHPSYATPLIGHRSVLSNWKRMFGSKNVNTAFQKNWIEPTNIHVSTIGSSSVAIVTCHENVYVRRFVRGEKRQTMHVNTLQATNIYRKVAGTWYLQYHHSSTIPSSSSKVGNSNQPLRFPVIVNKNGLLNGGTSSATRRSRLFDKNKFDESDPDDDSFGDNNGNQKNMEIGMDGILGLQNYGADLGNNISNNSNNDSKKSDQPPQRRIIMGSLSDLLNGNLGDLLSGSNMKSGSKSEDGNSIIQFSRIDSTNNDDDEESDDEDDDYDDDDEYDDDEEEEDLDNLHDELNSALDYEKRRNVASVAIIKEWADSASNKVKKDAIKKEEEANAKKLKEIQSVDNQEMVASDKFMRQECIATLRKLTQQGVLSSNHKRVLLSDIISCAATPDTTPSTSNSKDDSSRVSVVKKSMVQVAFELLLGNEIVTAQKNTNATAIIDDDDDDWKSIAEEEFAEQCRIYADEMISKQLQQ